ncbi:MAG: NAD-dependent epimerase/dehydratase family protein [Actinobacteria bacterium]|nr:NAD-dependent epimerase/dehydratase family protein [Actinomycetota bacterium]
MGRRVLITGVSRFLGGHLARRLEQDPDVEYLVGVDLDEPELDLERTEYVRADIRNPLVVKILQTTEVDTVVHPNIVATPPRVGGRAAMKELNVIGTLQLFAACQKAERVKRVIVKSTTAVYGADPRDPSLFTEDMSARSVPRTGYSKDSVEVEQYARDFGRRRPDVDLTILRFANFLGPDIETTLTRYFSLPLIPTPLGFDPRIQLIHEEDAIEVLDRAVREHHPGIYNVAADGVVYLSQALRTLGRPPVPVPLPLVRPLGAVLRRVGLVDYATDQLRFLLYGRVADNGRLKDGFGYRFRHTTRDTLLDFAEKRRLRRLITPERVEEWERDVYEFLRRRSEEPAPAGGRE